MIHYFLPYMAGSLFFILLTQIDHKLRINGLHPAAVFVSIPLLLVHGLLKIIEWDITH